MIDLHTHTTYSDGTWSVEGLLENAEKSGVSMLSITDHDTALAHINMKEINVKKHFSGRIIVGGEFGTTYDNVKIELLGYQFDPYELQKWINKTYTKKDRTKMYEEEFKDIKRLCQEKGIRTTSKLTYNKIKKYPITIIYEDIIKYEQNKNFFTKEQWESEDTFFRSCTSNTNFILYRDFSEQYPTAKEVSNQIRKARWKSIFSTFVFV